MLTPGIERPASRNLYETFAIDTSASGTGSVYKIETRCGNPGCHCAQPRGRLHPATVLSWSDAGRNRVRSLSVEQRAPFRRLAEQYRRLRQARAAMVRLQQQMLHDIDRLEQALRLPPPPPAARRKRAARLVPRRPRG
jgi:hypothetical protein